MIVINLTPEENLAWQQCGQAGNLSEMKNFMLLKLVFQHGMTQTEAEEMAGKVADAAQRARRKIEDATRYEIAVAGE